MNGECFSFDGQTTQDVTRVKKYWRLGLDGLLYGLRMYPDILERLRMYTTGVLTREMILIPYSLDDFRFGTYSVLRNLHSWPPTNPNAPPYMAGLPVDVPRCETCAMQRSCYGDDTQSHPQLSEWHKKSGFGLWFWNKPLSCLFSILKNSMLLDVFIKRIWQRALRQILYFAFSDAAWCAWCDSQQIVLYDYLQQSYTKQKKETAWNIMK